MNCVALKVQIGLDGAGHAAYPKFRRVMQALGLLEDWSHYIDRFGGWHYDKVAGHADDDPAFDSPTGTQWGMICCPVAFAEKAVELFPEVCEVMDEATCAIFYDTRAHGHEPEQFDDLDELQAIAVLEQLGEDVTARKQRALDPDNPARGRRRNRRKTWQQYKQQRGIDFDGASVGVLSERRRVALEASGGGDAPDAGGPAGP